MRPKSRAGSPHALTFPSWVRVAGSTSLGQGRLAVDHIRTNLMSAAQTEPGPRAISTQRSSHQPTRRFGTSETSWCERHSAGAGRAALDLLIVKIATAVPCGPGLHISALHGFILPRAATMGASRRLWYRGAGTHIVSILMSTMRAIRLG